MRNAYYLVQLPENKSLHRLEIFINKGLDDGLPHQLPNYRLSLDGRKAIVQADITPEMEDFLTNTVTGQTYYTYLGENRNGVVDASVYEYLAANRSEWEESEL